MICPVCGKKFSFFKSGGIYCSPECEEKAQKELEDLLERMEKEEDGGDTF
jgi:predicted nucleic acid-binding Zn ribbon protein